MQRKASKIIWEETWLTNLGNVQTKNKGRKPIKILLNQTHAPAVIYNKRNPKSRATYNGMEQ